MIHSTMERWLAEKGGSLGHSWSLDDHCCPAQPAQIQLQLQIHIHTYKYRGKYNHSITWSLNGALVTAMSKDEKTREMMTSIPAQ